MNDWGESGKKIPTKKAGGVTGQKKMKIEEGAGTKAKPKKKISRIYGRD